MTDVRSAPVAAPVELATDGPLAASFDRLTQPDYAVDRVMAQTVASDWPGDLAGRLLLALARFARAGAPAVDQAVALSDALIGALADRGYIGDPLGDVISEQQVACHGWVVAGLLQHFYVTGDCRARDAALRVVDSLLLPALARLDTYPRDRAPVEAGGASGTATAIAGGWSVSSDVWCVLLSLNGLVPAALETGRADLAQAIDVLADELGRLDLVGQQVQLHAALAAARCLADWSEATGDMKARQVAATVYDTYATHARTLNYSAFNWFGRPDTWTEACAVVDSLGLAHTLGRLTGDTRYHEDAVRITYWALGFAERRDGSFGLDTIATTDSPTLTPITYDAWWCCTVRGAVGLLEARENGTWPAADVPTLGELPQIAGTFGPDDQPLLTLPHE